jgi:hypothetical protein
MQHQQRCPARQEREPGYSRNLRAAANYAFQKRALVVSVAFNDAADLDHNGDKVRFPCEAAHVICASATGPTGAVGVNGPWENVDAPAPYSAFGRSAVDVAAPGGAGEVGQFRRMWVPCTTTPTQTTGPSVPPPRAHRAACRYELRGATRGRARGAPRREARQGKPRADPREDRRVGR